MKNFALGFLTGVICVPVATVATVAWLNTKAARDYWTDFVRAARSL